MARGRGSSAGKSGSVPASPRPAAPQSTPTILEDGTEEWRNEMGKLHREGDQPASVSADGQIRRWFRRGKLHRDGDQPAIVTPTEQVWYRDGVVHRDGGLPSKIKSDGSFTYKVKGKLHRADGPAVRTRDGHESYWYEGKKLKSAKALQAIVDANRPEPAPVRRSSGAPRTVRAAMNRR